MNIFNIIVYLHAIITILEKIKVIVQLIIIKEREDDKKSEILRVRGNRLVPSSLNGAPVSDTFVFSFIKTFNTRCLKNYSLKESIFINHTH